jgi:hypothetical protein
MFWFEIGCAIGGLGVGWLLRAPVIVALTSFLIVLFTLALALADEISRMAAFLWAFSGLFFHQSAYLAGAIMRVTIERTSAIRRHSVSAEIDAELSGIERVATRLASQAPQLRPEAAILSHLASQLRQTLNDQRELEALMRERRSGVRLDCRDPQSTRLPNSSLTK